MEIYEIEQSGKQLIGNFRNVTINKRDNKIQALRFAIDENLKKNIYVATKNPLTKKYTIMPLPPDNTYVVGTNISNYPGNWKILLLSTEHEIVEGKLDQSDITYITDMATFYVSDNFLSDHSDTTQMEPSIQVLYDDFVTAWHELEEASKASVDGAKTATEKAGEAKLSADKAVQDVSTAKTEAIYGIEQERTNATNAVGVAGNEAVILVNAAGESQVANFDAKVQSAKDVTSALATATDTANTAKSNLTTETNTANTAKTNLVNATSAGDTARGKLETATTNANTAKTNAEKAQANLQGVIDDSTAKITSLQGVIDSATAINNTLGTTNNTASTAKTNLETAINNASTAKSQLEQVITNAGTIKSQLSQAITDATAINSTLNGTIQSGRDLKQDLDASNASAKSNIEELRSENFNSKEILAGVTDLRAFLGLENTEVAGITVDFTNKTFTRLAGAEGLSGGADFDKFAMYGGRKRCNVNNAGAITAWFGDSNYKEDGSNGQVMVYQPKFYYMMYPIKLEPITPGIGYHIRKANYYVSDYPLAGFKLHPAFYDAQGNEIDYILMGAYEGSIFDVSENAYILDDAQVMDYANDLFCSIAGAKPASGKTQDLTRPKLNQTCTNRGAGWYSDNIKATSANQMLMIIEMGMMNMQTAIGQGVVNVADNPNTENNSIVTGGTSALGNGTGQATGTSEQVSVSYRGYENPWGNIWKFIHGVNIWGDGALGGGVPYYATDFNFAESKRTDNYVSAGFSCANTMGYVSAIGYAPECDWMFIASETLGNSSVPVGDYQWATANLNGYRIAQLGGGWGNGVTAGSFFWNLDSGVGVRYRYFGGRLVYVPTATA